MTRPAGTARAPSLGRDALSGRLETSLRDLDQRDGPVTQWKRAWLLTALGRYGDALEACDQAAAGSPDIQACSQMTRAMLYRQISLHHLAEETDADALDLLQSATVRVPSIRAAIRIGQVADAVGLGLDATVMSRRLQVAAAAVTAAGSWRQGVRLTWVRGEVHMVRGQFNRAARVFAGGAKVASGQGAVRHQAKSMIFLAAARAGAGEQDEALRIAERGLQLAARCGAAPLMWPAELILAEVDPDRAETHLARARQFLEGILDTLPSELRDEALRQSPANWLVAGAPPSGSGPTPATDA
ncbi:hypothetical protein [Euzebya tangerina]|uniref:hypothetical protein n=1 Tax=Euzebya tangerina TaxID=591198 RepID=UPI000E31B17E|nr:hypothetical protein [Euzebya tangerina]